MSKWIVSLFPLAFSAGALACTSFLIPQSPTKVMARSFDWNHDNGLVVVNKRNVAKTALNFAPGEHPAQWVSRFGSVSFNQVGREFPLEGINEKGLAVEIMWLDSSVYPKQDATPALNELQWIQYILDRSENVEEAIAASQQVRVADVFAKVHYLACDVTGSCATFEYIDGKLVVHSGHQLPVPTLTNDSYEASLAFLDKHLGFGGTQPIPQSTQSLDRFAQASARAQHYSDADGSAVDYAFSTLSRVAQSDYSKWNVVYELAAGRVHYRTLGHEAIKNVDLRAFDYSCRTQVEMRDMSEPDSTPFTYYTQQVNQQNTAAALKGFEQQLPPNAVAGIAAYPNTDRCLD